MKCYFLQCKAYESSLLWAKSEETGDVGYGSKVFKCISSNFFFWVRESEHLQSDLWLFQEFRWVAVTDLPSCDHVLDTTTIQSSTFSMWYRGKVRSDAHETCTWNLHMKCGQNQKSEIVATTWRSLLDAGLVKVSMARVWILASIRSTSVNYFKDTCCLKSMHRSQPNDRESLIQKFEKNACKNERRLWFRFTLPQGTADVNF